MKVNYSQIEIDKRIFKVEINYSDIVIDKSKIGLAIGYSNGVLPTYIEEMLNQIILQSEEKCEIHAGYCLLDLNFSHDKLNGLFIDTEFFRMDKIVTGQLKKANKVAIFLCTIGPEMELWAKQLLAEGNTVLSYLVDMVASTAVESIADILHDHIGLEMEKYGWKRTNRYSPGYCNWSVSEQQKLFAFLPHDFCNIKLTDSSIMIPIKSISGVIGLGKEAKYTEYICDRCGIKDCTHRVYLLSKKKQQESKINNK